MSQISTPRGQEGMPIKGDMAYRSTGQQQWEKEVWEGLNKIMEGITAAVMAKFTLTFTSVPLQSNQPQSAQTPGSKQGDLVILHPTMFIAGIIFTGIVTDDGQVTVYANNYTSDFVTPGTIQFTGLFIR